MVGKLIVNLSLNYFYVKIRDYSRLIKTPFAYNDFAYNLKECFLMIDLQYGEGNVLIPKTENNISNLDLISDATTDLNLRQEPCNVTPSLTVDFCCNIDLPNGFKLADQIANPPRLLYSVECLSSSVTAVNACEELKCGPVFYTCYCQKITGCIPYVVSVAIESKCGGEVTSDANCNVQNIKTNVGYICCKGNTCVDVTTGQSTTNPNPINLDCNNVKLTRFKAQMETHNICNISCDHIVVVGTFSLPPGNTPVVKCPS
ncbi:hypothetical protein [Bacillus subtilis]|uniref:hypothetical protein n=1 Tax=Bacillus subtilis TaxID=1423 RepID=UPI0023ED24BF|nr:hypothetical protein [Bacillus subtilis]MDF4197769.1 hypothetical protein [Bacillus subtilis]MDF4215498.1 hypothetical protein [Bacillus subtilis]